MIAAGYGTSVAFWNPFQADQDDALRHVNPFPNCSQLVCDVCWSPEGDILASCGRLNGLSMYASKRSDVFPAATASRDVSSALAFSSDHLLLADSFGQLQLWACAVQAGTVRCNEHSSLQPSIYATRPPRVCLIGCVLACCFLAREPRPVG
jgi:WD40 repeat protein